MTVAVPLAVLAAFVVFHATGAHAGWQSMEWGMNPTAVLQGPSQTLSRLPPDEVTRRRLRGEPLSTPILGGSIEMRGFSFLVTAYFTADRLSLIHLNLNNIEDCPSVMKWMAQENGPPGKHWTSKVLTNTAYAAEWTDLADDNTIRVNWLEGGPCAITLKPLSPDAPVTQ